MEGGKKNTTVGSDHYPVMTIVGTKICFDKEKKFLGGNWEMLIGMLSKRSVQADLKTYPGGIMTVAKP